MRPRSAQTSPMLRRGALICAAVLVVVAVASGRADAAWTSSASQSHNATSSAFTGPADLVNTGSGTILLVTWADFSWTAVEGAASYDIEMDPYAGLCFTTVTDNVAGPSSGRVSSTFLCLGARYNVRIRPKKNNWTGTWSSWVDIGAL